MPTSEMLLKTNFMSTSYFKLHFILDISHLIFLTSMNCKVLGFVSNESYHAQCWSTHIPSFSVTVIPVTWNSRGKLKALLTQNPHSRGDCKQDYLSPITADLTTPKIITVSPTNFIWTVWGDWTRRNRRVYTIIALTAFPKEICQFLSILISHDQDANVGSTDVSCLGSSMLLSKISLIQIPATV